MPLLVIGYGNPLRGDDGLGWWVAEQLQARHSEADVIVCQQITPELAEPLSRATRVAFVDVAADRPPGALAIMAVQPEAPASASFTHQLAPSALLYLAHVLYGQTPEARLYSLGGQDFGYGEALSAPVLAAGPELVEQIEAWAGELA